MAQGFRGKKSEFDQKMIDLRRVARVVAGGRRFSFRATLVIGDRHGRVGVGTGKGTDAALSLEKALREAKKNMFTVPLKKNGTIPFQTEAKFGAARVLIRPTAKGSGLVAGGAVRTVLDMAGIKNTSAKILSHTKNKISNALVAEESAARLQGEALRGKRHVLAEEFGRSFGMSL